MNKTRPLHRNSNNESEAYIFLRDMKEELNVGKTIKLTVDKVARYYP